MNEILLDEILLASYEAEFSHYNSVPAHIYSKRHDRAMKRIFKIYERKTAHLRDSENTKKRVSSHLHWNRKTVTVLLVVILLAALAGCAVVIYTLGGFKTDVQKDNTQLFPVDLEGCPQIIEEVYYLSKIPDGFDVINTEETDYYVYSFFKNEESDQTITFRQWSKYGYVGHENTELGKMEEIEINGMKGLYIDYIDSGYEKCDIIWDNGDYVFEILSDLPKYETIVLAKSAKIQKY